MTSFIQNFSRKAAASDTPTDPRVARVLEILRGSTNATTEEQIRITEIPAPPFQESVRAAYMKKVLASTGLRVEMDDIGNVIGEWPGSSPDIVMLTAHLDTVFPAGTDVHVKREGGRLLAPGISDNGTGLAALVALSKAFREAKIKTTKTILFVADVGEEGEGNLRGMRALVDAYKKRLKYVLALDGSATEYVTTAALASRRVEITITGPGGHSWSDFGAPNPIHALGRGIGRFVTARVPESPRTSFNIGEIEGGTSVNSIPSSAHMKVDLRSESETELAALEALLRDAVKAGIDEEMSAARERGMAGSANYIESENQCFGSEAGGRTPREFAAPRRFARGRQPARQPFAPGALFHRRQYSALGGNPGHFAGRRRTQRRRSHTRRMVRPCGQGTRPAARRIDRAWRRGSGTLEFRICVQTILCDLRLRFLHCQIPL